MAFRGVNKVFPALERHGGRSLRQNATSGNRASLFTRMSSKVVRLCHFALLLGLFAVQAIHLDCDPSPLKTVVDFADEGLWNHNARCKVLFGSFAPDDLSLALVAAPLFTAAQWTMFSLGGVSYFTARLTCLISLWLIDAHGLFPHEPAILRGAGLLAALALGAAHEMLMYAKWATPVMPEMMFLTAVLFFWELGRRGSPRWMAVSGACFIAALLTKMTSLQFLPALAVFVGLSYWPRRDIDTRRLLYFATSAGLLGLVVALCYLPFLHAWTFVSQNLWQNVWKFQAPDVKELCIASIHIWFLPPMVSPGGVMLTALASLWGLDVVVRAARHGLRRALREISAVEFYSLCWLVGSLLVLTVVPYKLLRRFAMLIIPLALLAVSLAARTLGRGAPRRNFLPAPADLRCRGRGGSSWASPRSQCGAATPSRHWARCGRTGSASTRRRFRRPGWRLRWPPASRSACCTSAFAGRGGP